MPETILIVDDTPANLGVLVETLGAAGYRLMVAEDGKGQARSYLSSEENFKVLKQLHEKNLLVPVVGNFAGPKAVKSVSRYLKDHDAVVSAFYLSNVEQYLQREGTWYNFCQNVSTLPLDESSTFIRSVRNSTYGPGVGLDSVTANMLAPPTSTASRRASAMPRSARCFCTSAARRFTTRCRCLLSSAPARRR